MKAETLKKSILQYAMQGKLVEQNPDDEPASELLKRIKAEKEQLIKDGKIKKEKPLPLITDDEIPYELPQGWEWVRLGNIINITSGKFLPSSAMKTESTIPVYGGNGINGYHNEYLIDKPTLIIGRVGFYCGCVHLSTGKAWVTDNAFITSFSENNININFLKWLLIQAELGKNDNATAQPVVSGKKIYPLLVALPPLAEQQRIVEKLEQILPLIEEYGKNEEKLSELNKTLLDKIKQSILQHAVQGKLVPQNSTDEPASELLKRIKAEKEQLIKDGKTKKEKPLTPITKDEIPYELPQGWEWVRLRELTEIITKGSSPSWQGVNYTDKKEVLFITSENVGIFNLLLNKIKYVESKFNEIEPRSILEYNDILMNIVGASIGRTAIFQLKDVVANINQATCIIRLMKTIKIKPLLDYLLLFFNSSVCHSYMYSSQVDSARANLSMTNIANFLIPLPPLAEQQRIVDKVEELLSITNNLTK